MIRTGFFLFLAFLFCQLDAIGDPPAREESLFSGTPGYGSETDIKTAKGENQGINAAEDSVQFTYPLSTTVVKRNSPITIRWKGGQPGTTYFLELYKGGIYEQQIAEIVDLNQYEWQATKELNGGKDYQFRLVNSRFFGDFSFSSKFEIKNRIPRAFWVVPAAVGAAGIYFLVKLIIDNRPEPVEPDLPAPIEPY
jgi:hypothetical protein